MLPPDTIIEVHSKIAEHCPFCAAAKAWLATRGIPFTEIVHDDFTERNAFYDSLGLTGRERSVPQIILVDEEGERFRIGGYSELQSSGIE
jgi:glutaredoxin